jgi:hypothetical protein
MRTEKVARDGKRKNVRDEDTYAGEKKDVSREFI